MSTRRKIAWMGQRVLLDDATATGSTRSILPHSSYRRRSSASIMATSYTTLKTNQHGESAVCRVSLQLHSARPIKITFCLDGRHVVRKEDRILFSDLRCHGHHLINTNTTLRVARKNKMSISTTYLASNREVTDSNAIVASFSTRRR